MEIAVALDGSKRRDLAFYPGDDLVLNIKVYAKDGDSEPISVINTQFVHGYSIGPDLGAEFTVHDSGREPYKVTGDVNGQTTTLAFGWMVAGQGYPEVFCWGGRSWLCCGRWPDVWGMAAENVQVKDVGQYYMSQDVEGILQEIGARQVDVEGWAEQVAEDLILANQAAAAATESANSALETLAEVEELATETAESVQNLLGSSSVVQDYRIGTYATSLIPLLNWVDNPRLVAFGDTYKAFPFSAKVGDAIVFIYSDGVGHGNSDKQIMCRSLDDGKTWDSVVFTTDAAPTVFNTTLLDGIMLPGESIVLKVYTIYRGPTTCFVVAASTVVNYQNLLTYSDDTENASWVLTQTLAFGAGSVADTTAVRDPSGNFKANFIVPAANATPHAVAKTITGLSPNQTLSAARWVKAQAGGPGYIFLGIFDADTPANYVGARITLANGAVAGIVNVGAGTGATASSVAFPDGWYLFIVTGKPNTAGTNTQIIERPVTSSGGTYTGNGINGYYHYRAQLQVGATLNQPLIKTEATAVSSVGSSNVFAWWGRSKKRGNSWYRTGYSTTPGTPGWVSGLFKSPDNMGWTLIQQWAVAGKDLNETDVEQLDTGDWVAIIREDLTSGRQLYFSYSTGSDSNWSAAQPISQTLIAGTQPNLNKLNNGKLILSVGDRTGSTGISSLGVPDFISRDRTGVSFSIAPSNVTQASDWSAAKQLGISWSTDCGQPMLEKGRDGNMVAMMYLRPKEDSMTGIYSASISGYQ